MLLEVKEDWMNGYESFGQCLQRILREESLSASEAARLVGFRSRNSIFRILGGETSVEVDQRFLAALRQAIGAVWPPRHWEALETALTIKRVGLQAYLCEKAFCEALHGRPASGHYVVEEAERNDADQPMEDLLKELCADGEISVVMCGCCESGLSTLLAAALNDAGSSGRLNVRHYIDVTEPALVSSILGVMPLLSKPWYNARLMDEAHCPPEMAAIYRLNIISIAGVDRGGRRFCHQLLQCDANRFVRVVTEGVGLQLMNVMDRYRFQLELLKPMKSPTDDISAFAEYTSQFAKLESEGMILSVKPDVHFNLVPSDILWQPIMDGFQESGLAVGEELTKLMEMLKTIQDTRVDNMYGKRRPTHLVYSLPAMEQFMRTGVQTDHFFLQRPYTLEERRRILRLMLQQMQENPFFNVHFLRPEIPELLSEVTFYEGKGVLLLDAFASYDLQTTHSEALITLPGFMQSFQKYFMGVLLNEKVLPRAESFAAMERLLLI